MEKIENFQKSRISSGDDRSRKLFFRSKTSKFVLVDLKMTLGMILKDFEEGSKKVVSNIFPAI